MRFIIGSCVSISLGPLQSTARGGNQQLLHKFSTSPSSYQPHPPLHTPCLFFIPTFTLVLSLLSPPSHNLNLQSAISEKIPDISSVQPLQNAHPLGRSFPTALAHHIFAHQLAHLLAHHHLAHHLARHLHGSTQ